MTQRTLYIVIILLLSTFFSKGQRIAVTGTPTFSGTALNVTEAGNNFVSSVTSTSGSSITVSNASTKYWHITVDRVDINWNSNLKIWVQRTGNGTGTYTPTGGTTFQEVTLIEATFFNGRGNRTSIPISYQVSGISMVVPSGSYSSTIYYTIYTP